MYNSYKISLDMTFPLESFNEDLDLSFIENNIQSNTPCTLDEDFYNEENINSNIFSKDSFSHSIKSLEEFRYNPFNIIDPNGNMTFNTLTETTKKNSLENKSNIFKTISFKQKKRGRRTEKINQKSHDSSSDDNCLRKIQNHFFNFIINLVNDVLTKENIKENFKPVDYKIKRNIRHDFFCELKTKSIKDILEMNITPKFKREKDINKKTINKIYNNTNWLNDFFNIKYLKLFSEYYNNEKPLLKFIFNEKEIEIKEAESFYFLINNKNNKIKKIEENLSNIAKRYFIDDNSSLNKIFFKPKSQLI